MARGIVEVTSVAGIPTTLVARGGSQAETAASQVAATLARRVGRGTLSPEASGAAISRLATTSDLGDLDGCDLVIEAVVEDLGVKRALFAELGKVCEPGTVLATTTSSLPVAACAEASTRPADVLGLHFFNPVSVMRLVEIVPTGTTRGEIVATACEFCRRLGKVPISCPDQTGFIVNRLLVPYLNNAARLTERVGTSVEGIDATICRDFGFPMGPFTLLDTIGLDVCLAVQRRLSETFGYAAFTPSRALERLVADGRLGRKTGSGFHLAKL